MREPENGSKPFQGRRRSYTKKQTTSTSTSYENIRLSSKGRAKITDFELAMLHLNMKIAGIVETVPLMAPKVNLFMISKKNMSMVPIFYKNIKRWWQDKAFSVHYMSQQAVGFHHL